ncbi:efflux RND transporter periplasmic adaptor subunit [Xenorhabdus szentirmaii]|uniref:efflux RND transporter periplasmic adaptor subunit n=1 Tax=Xenorhabdus szentirmaii TaxID=290112 RepID=UPI001991D7C6|nr:MULTISPECIES: efflux RND transporter periplasmic adaptor subunit [unclassified Xenorhabdus]MBD2790992.1 efflux RND transporter periplasmic adaptor subunit [Xenorhabdus sp. CUL]MBD2825212.1 efflux RND transporter periplasmic adaptor subunit [Xenorhabdus sp. 5]
MLKNRGILPLATLLVLSGSFILSGCKENQETQSSISILDVSVVTLKAEPLTVITELPGRTTAYRVAEVRPQVSGIILKRNYKEGSDIVAGESLYQIDPATYQAEYSKAKANLTRAQANEKVSHLTVERYKSLLGTQYVSKQEFDKANSDYAQANADVQSAHAALESARINLAYTKVTSPISGRAGKSTVTEGALVSAGQGTALTTVQQLDPIYVDITQSSDDYLKLKDEIAKGTIKKENQKTKIRLITDTGKEYSKEGYLEFSDVTVDETTSSITMRAVFPNPNEELLPGMFVRTKLEEGVRKNAILIPQEAVARTARGQATTMIVDKDNRVELRNINAAQAIGNKWLVTDGVSAGDKVIVNRLQIIAPGMTVNPKEQDLNAKPAANQTETEKQPQ